MVHHIDQGQGKTGRDGLGVIASVTGARPLVGMRHRFMVSTALMAVSCALPVGAQQIDYTGDVSPLPGPSPWSVGGHLYVGETAAGTLNILSGGQISSTSGVIGLTTDLSFPELRVPGVVTVSGADAGGNASTWTNSGSLDVGSYGDGTLIIKGGGQVFNADGSIARSKGAVGAVLVSGTDAAGNASTWTNAGTLRIGVGGGGVGVTDAIGTLTVEGGGKVLSTDGRIGMAANSSGTVTVTGTDAAGNASTWSNSGTLGIGVEDTGLLSIEAGGLVSNADGYIGWGEEGNGGVSVSGTDAAGNASLWTNSGDLFIGVQGEGELVISEGDRSPTRTRISAWCWVQGAQ